jgi:hypothetical protein
MFRKVGRRTLRAGRGRDLVSFLDAARVGLLEDEQDCDLLEFQCNVVSLGIPQVRAKHVHLLLTEDERDKLKACPASSLRRAFGFVQHEGFRAIYRRGEFFLLRTWSDASNDFPFPDARRVSEEMRGRQSLLRVTAMSSLRCCLALFDGPWLLL